MCNSCVIHGRLFALGNKVTTNQMTDISTQAAVGQRAMALIQNFPNGDLVLFDDDLRYRVVGPDVLPRSRIQRRPNYSDSPFMNYFQKTL